MYLVTKEFKFEAAHRLLYHLFKCRNVHGHSYRVQVTLSSERTRSESGMVVDFGLIKEKLQPLIDDNFDHMILLNRNDPLAAILKEHGQKVTAFDGEPTAENMAKFILDHAVDILEEGPGYARTCAVDSVVVYETETCCAEVTRS